MKKAIAAFIIGGILGVFAGAGAMLIAFPFLFPPPQVDERASAFAAGEVIAAGVFREGVSGQDAGHWGRGSLKIYEGEGGDYLLELQGDFEVGAGPNFWLYINAAADINDEDDFAADDKRVKIAKLKSFAGSQVYRIRGGDFAGARAVTIWCETFGQYIASANVEREKG
jgi:hypothetical protein